ncbi:Nn.00g057970.m01.CDS01 [Neocucurbitaria sp. VM-36]
MLAVLSYKEASYQLPSDWELVYIILGVIGIVFLEILIVFGCIRLHNLRSKARWRRLRERGVVVVNGPALIWADDLPPQPTFSSFNLRHILEDSNERGA